MTAGLNSEFKNMKGAFLRNRPITVGMFLNTMPATAGIGEFDIQPRQMQGGHVYEVLQMSLRTKKQSRWKTHAIQAYWLPWQSQQAVSLDIGDQADYFFTSELNGCQFRIARTGNRSLRIVHTAGDGPSSATAAGTAWRDNKAQSAFSQHAHFLASRTLSSSRLVTDPPTATGKYGYDGNHSWTNVVGFRLSRFPRRARWDVWYQTVDGNYNFIAYHLGIF